MEVALLAEGVDRNCILLRFLCFRPVALLAEGVDRNFKLHHIDLRCCDVALLAEGVDRNDVRESKYRKGV